MEHLKEHIGIILTAAFAAAGGLGAVIAKLNQGAQVLEEEAIDKAMDKILANPEAHHILVRIKPQLEASLDIANKKIKEKLDAAQ